MKTVFGLSIAALLTVFIACPQPAGPGGAANSGSPSSPQTPPPKTPVEKALGELTVSPVQVYKDMSKVELPTTTSVAGVTISWTALPEGYINLESGTEWGKIKKRPAGSESPVDITLTATATKDGKTKTKDFTITIHPATAEPDAQALASSLSCPASVSQDFILQKNVDGYPTATIAWESADDKIIKIESGSDIKGIVGYDLIDRTVKLTATINYNSGTGTKDFNVIVEHFANKIKREDSNYIKEYEFTGTELTFTRTDKHTNKINKGYKYAYTDVNPESKTAVFQETAHYDSGEEKWITSQGFPSRRYIYGFAGSGTNLRFNTSLPYDSGKPWYEQEGGYDFQNTSVPHPAPAGTIMFIYFRVNKSGSNTYSAYIAVHKADGSGNEPQCDNRSSQAPFTPPNSPMTATLVEDGNPSNQLSIEIKDIDDAGDGTMSANIKIDSGVFESYTLKFRGNSLPLY